MKIGKKILDVRSKLLLDGVASLGGIEADCQPCELGYDPICRNYGDAHRFLRLHHRIEVACAATCRTSDQARLSDC